MKPKLSTVTESVSDHSVFFHHVSYRCESFGCYVSGNIIPDSVLALIVRAAKDLLLM